MSKVLVDRELLPCPFCGQQDAFVEQLDSDASVVICQGMVDEHSACLARGPVGVQQSDLEDQPGRDAAIAEWNRRAQPAPPQDEREADRDFERYADECSITPNDPVVLRRDQANAYMASMKLLKLEDREYLPDAIRQLQSNYAAAVKGRANFRAALREARATRPEQTEQQATVKHSLTVQPVAYAVFAENGNVVCFSTRRDHPSLVALESEGKSAVPLAPIAQTALSAVTAERDRLLDQVKALQSDANSWQSGYDKGRHDGTKHRHSEVAQLRAEVEALRKDAVRWRYVRLQGDDTHWLNLLRVDLDEFGGNINAAVDALIDGEAPDIAAKEV